MCITTPFPHPPSLSCCQIEKSGQCRAEDAVLFCVSWTTGEIEQLLVLTTGFHLRSLNFDHFSIEMFVSLLFVAIYVVGCTHTLDLEAFSYIRCYKLWRFFSPLPTSLSFPSFFFGKSRCC